MKSEYITDDLSLATTLSLFIPLEEIRPHETRKGKVYFVFNDDGSIKDLVDKFWTDELKVSPKKYYQELRVIKARMYGGQDVR